MASFGFRRDAIGLTLLVATLMPGLVCAGTQPALPPLGPPHPGRQYAVGDEVPSSVKPDDDGFPDRPYAILIVDGAVVVVVDRMTRRVVQVLQ